MKRIKKRNPMVALAFAGEINLQTRVIRDKTKYYRKEKFKCDYQ